MSEQTVAYGGQAELDVLEDAVRYNAHIAGRFVAAMPAHAKDVLDFGAGVGTITALFAERTGLVPCTVELDATQRARLVARGFRAEATVQAYPEASFDFVLSSNVLEHIPDDVAALSAVRSRLRPGGRAAFWVPAFPLLWTALDDRVAHVRRYRSHSLRACFEQAGFRVLSVRHEDSLGFFAALLFKAIGRRDGALDARAVRLYDRFLFPVSRVVDRATSAWFGKNLLLVAERA